MWWRSTQWAHSSSCFPSEVITTDKYSNDLSGLSFAAKIMIFCNVCVCFPQDAAGEELRGAVVFFCDGVGAGGHPAAQSVQQSDSSDRQLQNRGEAHTGEVDTPCFTGNKPQVFWDPDCGTVSLNMP